MWTQKSKNIIEFTESDLKSKTTVRLFNKLSSNLKVLFHEQKYIGPGNTKLTSQFIYT